MATHAGAAVGGGAAGGAGAAPMLFLEVPGVPRGPPLSEEVLRHVEERLRHLHRFQLARSTVRRAAVMIPLCTVRGESAVALTLRTARLSTHASQVSFPGGHIEEGESEEDAARREFAEEMGAELRAKNARVCGRFHDAVAITGTHVHTVAAFFGALDSGDEPLAPNTAEVEAAFSVPLRALVDPSIYVVEDLSMRMSKKKDSVADERLKTRAVEKVPAFYVPGAPARVWGLTGYILDAFLRQVLLPAFRDAGVGPDVLPDLPALSDARVVPVTD
jgi:8-oxo-dGTP pyrophosphatase MutT (NUDIX family)